MLRWLGLCKAWPAEPHPHFRDIYMSWLTVKRYLTSEPSFHTLHLSFTLHLCVLCSLCYIWYRRIRMIPPTVGSAAAVVTHSRKKPLSVCFERAWMSRYPNLFREELSELARFHGGLTLPL
jgi:hypothetical protein